MGTVYRATQLSLNRVVALKLLASDLSDDSGFRTRFQREGLLQAGLDHQHIVPIYEAGQTEQGLFLAMRLVAGPTLKELIVSGRLEPRTALRILAQVAQALDAAHDAGLIHRDVKPQNILIDRDDHAYLADFGLIKDPEEAEGITGPGQFVGTIDYTAPEQIQHGQASAASDCYSLAAVLFECLTGEVPFNGSETAVMQAHLTEPPPRVTDLRPELPPEIDHVIARGMAKDPAARPLPTSELIRDATRALTARPRDGREGGAQQTRLARVPLAPGQPTAASPAGASPARASPDGAAAVTAAARAGATVPAGAVAAPVAPTTPRAEAASKAPPRPRAVPLAVGALLAAVALAAGYLVGHGSPSSTGSSFANSASAGPVAVRYPSTWQVGGAVPSVPGIGFSSPIKLLYSRGTAGLTAGEVAGAGGPTLLLSSFRTEVQGGLPHAQAVSLSGVQAYSYSGMRVNGLAGTLTVYAAPTSAGVATIACWSSAGTSSSLSARCGQLAATLHLLGARAYSLSPSSTYAHTLSTTFTALDRNLSSPDSALRHATTPAAQATAERQIGQAYASARRAVRAAATTPLNSGANAALASALGRLDSGYTAAGSAARTGDSSAYQKAQSEVSAGSTALTSALNQLASLGYRVRS